MWRESLQIPRLRIPRKVKTSESLYRNHVVCGASTEYLTQIHASGSLHDPGLRACYKIHVSGLSARSMSPDPLEDLCLRIHVCGGHICDPARRSMSPDACLSVSASIAMDALQQMNQNRNDATARAIRHAGHPQRVVLQTWNRHAAPKRSLNHTLTSASQYEYAKKKVPTTPWRQPQRETHFALPTFGASKRKFWRPEARFTWPCTRKTLRPHYAPAANLNQTVNRHRVIRVQCLWMLSSLHLS